MTGGNFHTTPANVFMQVPHHNNQNWEVHTCVLGATNERFVTRIIPIRENYIQNRNQWMVKGRSTNERKKTLRRS